MASEEERPFKAEYAKSGRAGCKLCKGNISKDTLRMAKMVQSPFFDGKQPNWFHFACFFKQCHPDTDADISGFGSLRWDDQERLRAKMGGTDATDSGAVAETTKKKGKGKGAASRKITRSDLKVEYAKSNRSTCKGCLSQIDKDEIRIAKMEQSDVEKRSFAGLVPSWHHVECFLDRLDELSAEGISADELSGYAKLKKDDQEELAEKLAEKGAMKVEEEGTAAKGKAVAGKKRKVAAESKAPPTLKKSKSEISEEAALKEQSKLIWKTRDELQAGLSMADLRMMLSTNNQSIPSGESKLLDRCADGMVFGVLKPCPECGGQLTARTHTYQCTGDISVWTKCTHTTDDPARGAWLVPDELKEVPFLSTYKFKARTRVFQRQKTPSAGATPSVDMVDAPGPSKQASSSVDAPLRGFTIICIGRLSKTKPEITRLIESMGGAVVSKITDSTTICLSTKKDLEKPSKRMAEVEECDVPVVGEEFLDDAPKGAALLKIPTHTISSWGAPRHSLPGPKKESKAFESHTPRKVRLTLKGAAAVDPESELEDTHHVLEEGGVVYNAVLGLVDVVRGTNSYYKLQLLQGDKGSGYCIFRSWGRVGTTIGGTKLQSHGGSKASAIRDFTTLYHDKTGNAWENRDRDSFVKHAGKFYPLEIDYGQEQEDLAKMSVGVGSCSTLAPAVQELVRLLFDVESMKRAMLEFEIDMKKMPLGKLSKRQIRSAYSVLSELQSELSAGRSPAKILDASNRFYTFIPHDFGLQKPPLLDSEDVIRNKTQMLDNLLEIEVAYSLLKQEEGGASMDPLDHHYKQLKTHVEVVAKDSQEFAILQEYVANTHAVTHSNYSLAVVEAFKVVRDGEHERYSAHSKKDNRMLLWHGSRKTNFVGILSQGLRIAPPEAPSTGYMFGKGVYFADMVSKSANYCFTSRSESTGLMLLCEVALGDMYELTGSKFISKLPAGKHSTKGLGRTAPDPSRVEQTDTGAVIPLGKGMPTPVTHTSLLYNEFIVYDVAQISMKYLLKMDFQYRY